MKGIISIRVETRRVSYSLELRHNITVVQGDSGSGKSVLCDLISRRSNRQGSYIKLSVTKGYSCRHLTNEMCRDGLLNQLHNCIIFLDEDCDYIYSDAFARQLLGSTNYFVLITRHIHRLAMLSIHVNALCKLTLQNGTNCLVQQHSLADDKTYMCQDIFYPEVIVTEDSGSGFSFFSLVSDNCKTAKGRSGFISHASALFDSEHRYLIVADGGAFGGNINQVIFSLHQCGISSFAFYLPDSFEETLLHSLIFKGNQEIAEQLAAPWEYIDYSECVSFEQFFTKLLVKSAAALNFSYSKSGPLSNRFTNRANILHILELMSHIHWEIKALPEDTTTSSTPSVTSFFKQDK